MEPLGPETISTPPPGAGWVRLALGFYAAMGALAWGWSAGVQGRSLLYASPEAALRGVRWGHDVGVGLGAGLLAVVVSRAVVRHTRAGERLAQALGAALGPLGLRHCLLLALASGVGEEALFRGALQPSLGLVAASLVFGLVHLAPRRDLWPWSVFAFAGGLGLGALYLVTGNLVAPIVAHTTLNAVNLKQLADAYGTPAPRA